MLTKKKEEQRAKESYSVDEALQTERKRVIDLRMFFFYFISLKC